MWTLCSARYDGAQYKINDKINYKAEQQKLGSAAAAPPSINKQDKTSAGGCGGARPALICTLFSWAGGGGCLLYSYTLLSVIGDKM